MSRDNVQYSVNIYDTQYSGAIVELTGSAEPFVTEETDDDDLMVPIRYSTGTLSLINTGNLDGLFPPTYTGRKVTLTHQEGSATVVDWQGFIKQSQFTQPWAATPYEVQYPLVSAIGMLDSVEIQKGDVPTMARLAEYFRKALAATQHTFTSIVFPAAIGTSASGPWDAMWRFGIQDNNWFDYNSRNLLYPDETRYTGHTWMEIISGILQSFGLVMYERGQVLYIIERSTGLSTNMLQMDVSQLQVLAANGTPTTQPVEQQTINIANMQLAGSGGTVDIMPVRRKITVEADIHEYDDDALPQVDGKYATPGGSISVRKQSDGGYVYFDDTLFVYEPAPDTNIWTFKSYSAGQQIPWSGQDIGIDAHIGALCTNAQGYVLFINYNDVSTGAMGWGGDGLITVRSAAQSYFKGGYFLFRCKIDIYQGTGAVSRENWYTPKFQLRVGNLYYNINTNQWQTTPCSFTCKIDENDYITSVSFANHHNDGLRITPPSSGVFGDVELIFYDPEYPVYGNHQAVYIFSDVSLEYVVPSLSPTSKIVEYDTNRWAETVAIYADEDAEANLPLTSYIDSRMGYSVLMQPDLAAPLQKIYWRGHGNDQWYFEEMLLTRIAACYSTASQVLTIPLRSAQQLSPLNVYRWQDLFHYVSSTTYWRDGEQSIKIFRII